MSRSRTRKSSARRTPRILPQGVLKMSGAGYGFVQTSEGEFFIPASKTADAFDGDVVEVARIHDGEREGGFEDRLRGRVVRVVGRAHETVVGRYEIAEPFGVVVPEDPRIKHDIFTLRSDAPHVKDGDIVRVRMTSFPSRREPAQGVVEEVLGHEGQPGADVELIIARHKLATSFSATSLAEVEGAGVDADAAFNSGRYVDLRSELAFTVDPDDAKDFDDAVSAACVWIDGPATLRSAHRALVAKKEGSSEPALPARQTMLLRLQARGSSFWAFILPMYRTTFLGILRSTSRLANARRACIWSIACCPCFPRRFRTMCARCGHMKNAAR